MLNPSEKAYCQALLAVKKKEYRAASQYFEKAAPFFEDNKEFNLLQETTSLLLAVKGALRRVEKDECIEIEEMFTDGQENVVCRQGK